LGQIGGMYDNAGATKEGAYLVSITPGEIEFLHELASQFFKDKVGNHQLMMKQNIFEQLRADACTADVRCDQH